MDPELIFPNVFVPQKRFSAPENPENTLPRIVLQASTRWSARRCLLSARLPLSGWPLGSAPQRGGLRSHPAFFGTRRAMAAFQAVANKAALKLILTEVIVCEMANNVFIVCEMV